MNLIKLVYISTASQEFNLSAVDDILQTSQHKNKKCQVTGVLYYNDHYFLQYLEGEAQQVEATYRRIIQDSRHFRIILLDKGNIHERQFSDWSMAYVLESDQIKPINLYFMHSADFDPYRMTPKMVNGLIAELRSRLPSAHLDHIKKLRLHSQ